MPGAGASAVERETPTGLSSVTDFDFRERFPWWLAIMAGIVGFLVVLVVTNENYQEAFFEIIDGLGVTLQLTVGAFIVAMILGALIGIARVSDSPFVSTPAQVYIEFIRGVPMIVFIFAIAFAVYPLFLDAVNGLFNADVQSRDIGPIWRGAAALCLFYAAFIAEVFRAGIQSVDKGQIEAGRALGLSGRTIMRRITLPQAIRNTFPALGNDLIALFKDTSLVSVIAVAEMTYEARVYQGSSFRVRETFFILTVIYVTMTLILSLALRFFENRMAIPGR